MLDFDSTVNLSLSAFIRVDPRSLEWVAVFLKSCA